MTLQVSQLRVSVIIKALNEAANIGRAIESALSAIEEVESGEVIVADSLSSDQTIEIAKRYAVRIIQLVDPADRSCGVGAQLGYMVAKGKYLYILDGDMEFEAGFLREAVREMDQDFSLAGVGGHVREMNLGGQEFIHRASRRLPHMQPGIVDRLDMGGLYRRAALQQLGYFTNRNLHAYEEFELAARLGVGGWMLRRLDIPAVRHYGHTDASLKLLVRRWQSRYAWGCGELIRQSWGKPHWPFVIRRLSIYRLYSAVICWWLSLIVLAFTALVIPMAGLAWLLVFLLPWGLIIVRKRSIKRGFYAVTAWHVFSAGLVAGVLFGDASEPSRPVNFKQMN